MGEPSMDMVKLWIFLRIDFLVTRRASVLLLLSLRKFEVNQVFISWRQVDREEGGSVELGLLEM